MSVGTCEICGDEFVFGHDGDDPFTSISVSYHDDGRDDFSESVCQPCGDDLLADLVEAINA